MNRISGILSILFIATAARAGTLSGPILDEGVQAALVDLVQLPASAASPPLARIEFLREVPDGSGRLFANDMRGPLYVIQGPAASVYMDLSVHIPNLQSGGLQLGFVSFAFHPGFADNGLFYTAHTEHLSGSTPNLEPPIAVPPLHHAVITEWQASEPGADSFSGGSRELMRIVSPHAYHNLGEIGFDPNLTPSDPDYGLLYIAAGDFGAVQRGDFDQLQRLDTIYGCLLRINPLGGPFERGGISYPYGIPETNPYYDDGDSLTHGEIYAHGFRNPQNFHFDRGGDGTLFVTEIGESNLEEVNILRYGENFGWPAREGTYAIDVTVDQYFVFELPEDDPSLGFTYPVAQYDHEEGLAIAGGFVVRRSPLNPLTGKFIFGDIVNGRMFYSDVDEMIAADDQDPETTANVYRLHLVRDGVETNLLDIIRSALGTPAVYRSDVRFHSDLEGRLYVTTKQDGFIRELIPVPGDPTDVEQAPFLHAQATNVPNPFNPSTEIRFALRRRTGIRLSVFDIAGRRIKTLTRGTLEPGEHRFRWDGRNEDGNSLPSGVYLYRLEADERVRVGKMSLVR